MKQYAIKSSNGFYITARAGAPALSRESSATWGTKKAAEKALTQVKKFYSKALTYEVIACSQ